MENIPIFLELLDQPVKDPMLRPSNVEKWKRLLHITLLLSTFSGSVARTIARTVLFCYDEETAAPFLRPMQTSNNGCSKGSSMLMTLALVVQCPSWLLMRTSLWKQRCYPASKLPKTVKGAADR